MQKDMLLWIQGFAASWLDTLMIAFSFVGDEEFYVATVPLIYYLISKRAGVRLAIVLAMSTFVNYALKVFFNAPRPIGVEGIRSLYVESAPSMSFPSGHAQGSATYWGYLATQVRKPWFYGLAGFMVLSIMLSRLYLGVHWPIDVAAGLVFGLLFVAGMVWADGRMTERPLSFGVKLALGIALPLLLLLVYHEADGRKMVGFLLGCWSGYVLESHTIRMALPKSIWQRILPSLVGVAILFGLRALLKDVLPLSAPWDLVRYLLVGLTATLAIPWLFVKLRWYPRGTA
ncbi:phosphatase PAP2 family protein [Tumebacillus algifaecis]|uniref:phosphatase PAP2 family protein n=1 Tax=Tumebacillus algifaecis TaxID=1214604 RepID=UPI0012FDC58A|nr:phosphatase PAP2 family protein [Tumebacillus algifaecis]